MTALEGFDIRPTARAHVPGEAGVWVFVAGDLVVFALLFCTYLAYMREQGDLFAWAQQGLSQGIGVANTFLLLTSSWFVARAVRAAREGRPAQAARGIALTLLCGVAFLVNKGIEWSSLIHAGRTLFTDDFHMFFYMLTGIHALHVSIALGVLAYLLARVRRGWRGDMADLAAMEGGAVIWHLVDLLWIVLFALLYLVRRSP